MVDCSKAQLIGYLLDALDDEERAQIEQELGRRPELRRRLQSLKRFVRVLELGRVEFAPPPGLAQRTCERIFGQPAAVQSQVHPAPAGVVTNRPQGLRSSGRFRWTPLTDYWSGQSGGWSPIDLLAAGGVVLVLLCLLLPALAEVRFRCQVAACQDQLRELHYALSQYQGLHALHGPVRTVEASQSFLRTLANDPLVWSSFEGCPSIRRDANETLTPYAADGLHHRMIHWAGSDQRAGQLATTDQTVAGGSMDNKSATSRAGTIGPWDGRTVLGGAVIGGMLDGTRPDVTARLGYQPVPYTPGTLDEEISLTALALWRDRADPADCGGWSWNHGGRGENWLFADGHVLFVTRSKDYHAPPAGVPPPFQHALLSSAVAEE